MIKDDRIFYFLGNFSQHISHAMPLYKKIGGTVVVVSRRAEQELKKYKNLKVLRIDDKPKFWLQIDKSIEKTIKFLNNNADVVIFYDAFYWEDEKIYITKPTIFLGHGNGGVKSVLQRENNDGRWGVQLNHMTKVAQSGRDTEKTFLALGVDKARLVRVNTTRTDEIIAKMRMKNARSVAQKLIGLDAQKKTVAYMPTYWGPTSVMEAGLEIVRNISDEYNLIFWPHPQTPKEILNKYQKLIKGRKNIFCPQGDPKIEISDIYSVADVFIVDQTTSVVSDMMITKKPITFSFGSGDNYDNTVEKSPIRFMVEHSWRIDEQNVKNVNAIIQNALSMKYSLKLWLWSKLFIKQFVWLPNGGATEKTIKIIEELIKNGK